MPSSVIAWMDYDPATQSLRIEYRGGRGTYRYFKVPADTWLAFRTATSKGTYLNEVFKPKNYPYEKIKGPQPAPQTTTHESWGVPDEIPDSKSSLTL